MSGTGGRPRLLVLDALGGPHPSLYGPSIASLADLELIFVPPPFAEEAEARERVIRSLGETHRVERVQDVAVVAVELAERRSFDGLLSPHETLVAQAADAAEALGLPFMSRAAAERVQRKDVQRRALAEAGLQVPRTAVVGAAGDLPAALERVGLPAVLKPVLGFGGLATLPVDDEAGLRESLAAARAAYAGDPRMAHNPRRADPLFLLEQRLEGAPPSGDGRLGDYVSVESLVWRGDAVHVAVTEKLPLAFPFRETGSLMPSTLPAEVERELTELASAAIAALGVEVGAVHTEIKLTPDGPRVIEVNGRLGGPTMALLGLSAGYDVAAELCRIALGREPGREVRFHSHAAFVRVPSPPRAVRVRRVEGLDAASALPGVVDLSLRHPPGSEPDWRMGGRSSLVRALIRAATREELLGAIDRVRGTLEFELDELS